MLNKIKLWYADYKWKQQHEDTLKKQGWDTKCHSCNKWYFTDNVGKYLGEDADGCLHYKCTACQTKSMYMVTMLPIYVSESTFVELDRPYKVFDKDEFRYYRMKTTTGAYEYRTILRDLLLAIVTHNESTDKYFMKSYDGTTYDDKNLMKAEPKPVDSMYHAEAILANLVNLQRKQIGSMYRTPTSSIRYTWELICAKCGTGTKLNSEDTLPIDVVNLANNKAAYLMFDCKHCESRYSLGYTNHV